MTRTVTVYGVEMTVRELLEDVAGLACLFAAVGVILILGAGFQAGWIG